MDEKEKEHLEDMEDARDDRYKQEQERLNFHVSLRSPRGAIL